MRLTNLLPASIGVLALGAVALSACARESDTMVMFRDLADIPERPDVTAREVNENVAQSLEEERARAAQAAERLRNEPFAAPEPAPARPDP